MARVTRLDDAAEVLRVAGAFLATRPAEHNLILSLLEARAESGEAGRYWIVADDGPIGVVFESPLGFRATLTPMPAEAARAAVEAVVADGVDLPGVEGEAATVSVFAGHWSEVCRTGARPVLGTRLLALGTLTPPAGVTGAARRAELTDADLVSEWILAFAVELGEHRTPEDFVRSRVAAGLVTLWEDEGRAVGLVGRSPAVAGVVRIGPVYTPPEARRRGYAGAATGAVSAAMVAAGHRCILYTDLANPTSNSVYRVLGYRPIGESVRYAFDVASATNA